jgi:hypothetical protein
MDTVHVKEVLVVALSAVGIMSEDAGDTPATTGEGTLISSV